MDAVGWVCREVEVVVVTSVTSNLHANEGDTPPIGVVVVVVVVVVVAVVVVLLVGGVILRL